MAASMDAFEHFVRTGDPTYIPEGVGMGDNKLPAISPEMIAELRKKTGLLPSTIANLLTMGWEYSEQVNHAPVWHHPMNSLLDTRIDFT